MRRCSPAFMPYRRRDFPDLLSGIRTTPELPPHIAFRAGFSGEALAAPAARSAAMRPWMKPWMRDLVSARTRLCSSWLRSPDASAQLLDADQVSRGIAEGAVAYAVDELMVIFDEKFLVALGVDLQRPGAGSRDHRDAGGSDQGEVAQRRHRGRRDAALARLRRTVRRGRCARSDPGGRGTREGVRLPVPRRPGGAELGGAQTRWFSPRRRCEPAETTAADLRCFPNAAAGRHRPDRGRSRTCQAPQPRLGPFGPRPGGPCLHRPSAFPDGARGHTSGRARFSPPLQRREE